MRLLFLTIFIFPIANLYSQKFELVFGIGPTYSLTSSNISYLLEPQIYPTITIEDPRGSGTFGIESLDWINDKNYFGIEPSIEIGYDVGKELTFGFGIFGRHRQVDYDLFVPILDGISIYSHHFQLDFTFIATTFYLKYRHPNQKWNMSFNLGFNHPINKLERLDEYSTIIGIYRIEEEVIGPKKSDHGFTDFTLNPLARFALNKVLSERFQLGLFIEKQIKNEYGAEVQIYDTNTNQDILVSSVYGRDLTIGVKLHYILKG